MHLKIFRKRQKTIGKNEQLYCVNQKKQHLQLYLNSILGPVKILTTKIRVVPNFNSEFLFDIHVL